MNARTFQTFVKTATELQLRDDVLPADYLPVHAAVLAQFPKLAMHPAVDLAGLGMLAVPSVQHLRGKPQSESSKSKWELAGLGTLSAGVAAEPVRNLIKARFRR